MRSKEYPMVCCMLFKQYPLHLEQILHSLHEFWPLDQIPLRATVPMLKFKHKEVPLTYINFGVVKKFSKLSMQELEGPWFMSACK